MKKVLIILLSIALLGFCTACGGESADLPEENDGSDQVANPWVDCSTLEEAADLAGFEIEVPRRIDGYSHTFIQAIETEMIQVFYSDKDLDDDSASVVLIRKGVGEEDISGDYNEYTEGEAVELHGVEVTLKGNDGKVNNASWMQDGFSYNINADAGLTKDQIVELVEVVK